MRIMTISSLLIIVQALSSTFFQNFRMGNISPNFMLVIIVSFALLRGSKEGALIGIAVGVLQDASFSMTMGASVLVYTGIGYICGKFNKNFYRENFIIPLVCTFLSSLVYSIINLIVISVNGSINIEYVIKMIIVPELIYTVTLSLIIYQISYVVNSKIEHSEKKTRNIF